MANPTLTPTLLGTPSFEAPAFERQELTMNGKSEFVLIDGFQRPKGFRGDYLWYTMTIKFLYRTDMWASADSLIDTLETTYLSSDARWTLDHGDRLGQIRPTTTCEIHEWNYFPRPKSGIIEITMTLEEVEP